MEIVYDRKRRITRRNFRREEDKRKMIGKMSLKRGREEGERERKGGKGCPDSLL